MIVKCVTAAVHGAMSRMKIAVRGRFAAMTVAVDGTEMTVAAAPTVTGVTTGTELTTMIVRLNCGRVGFRELKGHVDREWRSS